VKNTQAVPRRVVIHSGTVFEVLDPFARVQNLVAANQTVIQVPPGGSYGVEIDTWCLNEKFAPPSSTAMRPTVLAKAGTWSNQRALWNDMANRA
jgi:hypothetical protein